MLILHVDVYQPMVKCEVAATMTGHIDALHWSIMSRSGTSQIGIDNARRVKPGG